MYLRVDLRASALVILARTAFHAAALVSLTLNDLIDGVGIALAMLIIISLGRCLLCEEKQPQAILFIDGSPHLLFRYGVCNVVLLDYFYCTAFLLVLNFRERQFHGLPIAAERPSSWKRILRQPLCAMNYCVVMLPDSSTPGSLRRLRTLLRWQGLKGSPVGG